MKVTGSLQIKSNVYYLVLNFKDSETGKRKQKWVNTKIKAKKQNKSKAEIMLAEELKKYESADIKVYSISVSEYFTNWLEEQQFLVAPNTYRGYATNMRNHIIPYFEGKRISLKDLTIADIERYYSSCLKPQSRVDKKGALSTTTVKHHHQNISKALNDAVRKGYITSNPAAYAKSPKAQKYIGSFLNPEQLNDMILLFEGTIIKLPVQLISIYGLRRSEVLGLRWDSVDFNSNQLIVKKALLQDTGGSYLKDNPKNESSYRALPLTNQARNILLQQKQYQENMKKVMGDNYIDDDYICTWADGSVIEPNYLSKKFHSIIIKSTLPHIRLHDLRHSTASNLLSMGFSYVEIQQWLGHSQPSTTLNFYSHVDSSSKLRVSSALDGCLAVG